jgi:hypothetical protein
LRNAVEAVTLWVEDARADGEKIPKPRPAEKLRTDPDVAAALAEGGVLAYVPLVLDAARPVKANLSLDAGLLSAIGGTRRADSLGVPCERGAREDRERGVSARLFRCSADRRAVARTRTKLFNAGEEQLAHERYRQ